MGEIISSPFFQGKEMARGGKVKDSLPVEREACNESMHGGMGSLTRGQSSK